MDILQRDMDEAEFVGDLIHLVNMMEQKEIKDVIDRMTKNQPFILSILLSYEPHFKKANLDEMMKMFLVIYLFFEEKTDIGKKPIDEAAYKACKEKNRQFVKYFAGEQGFENQLQTSRLYLSNLRFKSLFAGMIKMSNVQYDLEELELTEEPDSKFPWISIIATKALIDCLELNLLEDLDKT